MTTEVNTITGAISSRIRISRTIQTTTAFKRQRVLVMGQHKTQRKRYYTEGKLLLQPHYRFTKKEWSKETNI